MKTLREWRRERLLGLDGLVEKSGVSKRTIIQIEHGRQLPRFTTIRKLCEALGVEPRDVAEFAAALDADQGQQEAA